MADMTMRERAELLGAIEYHIQYNMYPSVMAQDVDGVAKLLMQAIPDINEQIAATGEYDGDKVYTVKDARGYTLSATANDLDEIFQLDRSGFFVSADEPDDEPDYPDQAALDDSPYWDFE